MSHKATDQFSGKKDGVYRMLTIDKIITTTSNKMILETFKDISSYISHNCVVSVNTVYVNIQFKDLEKLRFSCKFEELENYLQLIKMKITEYFNGQ